MSVKAWPRWTFPSRILQTCTKGTVTSLPVALARPSMWPRTTTVSPGPLLPEAPYRPQAVVVAVAMSSKDAINALAEQRSSARQASPAKQLPQRM